MSQSVSIAELMKTSGVSFGTSGARGTVAAMTDRTCWCYTTAFIEMLRRRGQAPQAMAIAGDLRPSTGRILAATAHALRSAGVAVRHCGRIPSPAVALYGMEHGLPTLMVTGSHIPDDRNGIKFTTAQGEITKEDEQAIREEWVDVPEATFGEDGMLLEPESMPEVEDAAAREYVARYLRWFGKESLRGLRVGLYEHSSVGRDLAAEVLRGLGAEHAEVRLDHGHSLTATVQGQLHLVAEPRAITAGGQAGPMLL